MRCSRFKVGDVAKLAGKFAGGHRGSGVRFVRTNGKGGGL